MTDNQFEQLFGMMTKTVLSTQELNEKSGKLEQKFDEFRDETRQSFVEVKKELRQMNRKVNVLTQDVFEVRTENKDLEDRIEVLEEKAA